MVNVTIDEAINGYIVNIFDWKEGKGHKEVCERRIDALQIVLNYVKKECEKEVKLIQEGGKYNVI